MSQTTTPRRDPLEQDPPVLEGRPATRPAAADQTRPDRPSRRPPGRGWLSAAITLVTLLIAAVLGYAMWGAFETAPWTRDGRVRVYVVKIAPEVSGQLTALLVRDNQFVHKGELLMRIDQRDYAVALVTAKARMDQAKIDMDNKNAEAQRRQRLSDLSTSTEERESFQSVALGARAALEAAMATLGQAHINMDRTEIRSPVNGWVTNLLAQQGDYAVAGQRVLSVVDADSFWIDGYFEETSLAPIQPGDPAQVWLMGYSQVLHGHVDSVSRGITVGNAAPDETGLASVNPIFTWVRLAQRVPVRVRLDHVPADVRLVQGMTASVQIDVPDAAHPRLPPAPRPAPAAPQGPTP